MNEKYNKINKISNYFIYGSVLCFILFYLLLAFYNRPVYDDFYFLELVQGKSLSEFVSILYLGLSGRWTTWVYYYLVVSPSSSFQDIPHYLFLYFFLTLLILIYSLNSILRVGVLKLFNTYIDLKTSLSYSVLFIACFYFFTFQNIEVWWYVCASFHYLQGIAFLLLGIAFILREQKKIFHYVMISLSFIYVGACFEIYPLVISSIVLVCVFYYLIRKKVSFLELRKKNFFKGLLLAFISMILSLIILLLAPGNFDRRTYFKEHFNEFYHPLHWNSMFSVFADRKYLVAVLLASVWLVLGNKLKNISNNSLNKKLAKNIVVISFLALVLSIVVVYFFSVLFTYGIMPPTRSWTFSSFVLAFILCFSFFMLGYLIEFKKQGLRIALQFVLLFLVFITMSYNLYRQNNFAKTYSKKYDQLIDSFIQAKKDNFQGTLYVDKLPESGMLMQLDFGDESYNPTALKNILGLNFEIKVKDE